MDMARDLRSYLEEIRSLDREQLIEVAKELSCKYDVIALSDIYEREGKFPIFLYHNVQNMAGKPGSRVW